MTPVYIILSIFGGLAVGAFLLGMALFFWYLLKVVRSMNAAMTEFTKVIDPLIKTGTLQRLGGSAAEMVAIGNNVLKAMGSINTTVGLFNKAFFSKESLEGMETSDAPTEVFAPKGEAFKISFSDEGAAVREQQEKLRQAGFETDETHPNAPIPSAAHGSQV